MTIETKTPYGTIYRDGDREWFSGSESERLAAKNWEYFANPEHADANSLAREAALSAERDEDDACRTMPKNAE
jgi:hypothetical protein